MKWLDIMPAIPLARGVPVRFHDLSEDQRPSAPWQGERGVVVHVEPGRVMVSLDSEHDAGAIEAGEGAPGWRVDLDDPQGFAYAVKHFSQEHDDDSGESEEQALQWVLAYLADDGLDTNRLALAKALKEVDDPWTYRAAIWTSEDGQADMIMTAPEDAYRTDSALLALGRIEATEQGLDPDLVEIGEWTAA